MTASLRAAAAAFGTGLLLAACSGAPKRLTVGETPTGEVVEVVGEAMLDGDVLAAKKLALVDAQKKAVEMVVGVRVSAKTMVEKAVAIEDNILARTEGYLQKYDVLKEWEDGRYQKVKIRAFVSHQKLMDDLGTLGLLKRPEVGNPRVAVLLTEKAEGFPDGVDGNPASQGLAQSLLDAGYRVVDRADMLAANAEKVAQQLQNGDVSGVSNMGKQLDAEVLIFGAASASAIKSDMLGGMHSYRATLNAQAYRAQTNEVLYTVGKVASGLDASREAALQKAMGIVGGQAGKDMGGRIGQELARRASIALTLRGVEGFGQVREVQKTLTATPGVGDYYLRSFADGQAVIDVMVKELKGGDLASSLEKASAFKAKAVSVTQDAVTMELASPAGGVQ